MKTLLLAALAALTPLVPASGREAAPATVQVPAVPAVERGHIRSWLYGDTGPVVVLVPGMSTPGAVWDDAVAQLSGDHRVLVVEVRGFDGERGTANERDGAIDGIVTDIAADLVARNLGPATIAGHSLGGLIAMRFGLDHPEFAANLLILDSLPFFGTVFSADMTLETVRPQADRMRQMLIDGADAMRAAGVEGTASGAGAMGMSVDEARRVKIANWSLDAEPLAVAQLVWEDTMMDLRQDIAALAMPVTVVHFATGEYADMARERYATDYAALDSVRIVPVDNSSHFVQLDRPEVVYAELRRLTGTGAGTN